MYAGPFRVPGNDLGCGLDLIAVRYQQLSHARGGGMSWGLERYTRSKRTNTLRQAWES